MMTFLLGAMAGMLIDWMKSRKIKNSDQIAEYIAVTVKGSLIGIFNQIKEGDGTGE